FIVFHEYVQVAVNSMIQYMNTDFELVNFYLSIMFDFNDIQRIIQSGTADFICNRQPFFQTFRSIYCKRKILLALICSGRSKTRQSVYMIIMHMCDEDVFNLGWFYICM